MPLQVRDIPLPTGGVDNSGSLANQREGTVPLALNVWGLDSSAGRQRLGIRPQLIGIGALVNPLNWCPITYANDEDPPVTRVGIAVVTSLGTYANFTDGASWTPFIPTDPGTQVYPNQATCAVFREVLYQAVSGADQVQTRVLRTGAQGPLLAPLHGPVPTKCGIVLAHGGRLWLMGDQRNPHVYYASAINDASNWDYASVEASGAFASTGSLGGIIGEPIHAAISHNENCLLIGSTDSVYSILGNPRSGAIRKPSANLGPITPTAWCKDGEGNTWLLTRKGLCVIPSGSGTEIQEVSSKVIPNEMIGVNPRSGDTVALGYDGRWNGIHIFIEYDSVSTTDRSFFYDLTTKAFWPQSFSVMPTLAATWPALMTDNNSSIIPFADNSVKQFKRDEEGEEVAEARDSYIWIPIKLVDDPSSEGLLHSIAAAMAYVAAPLTNTVDWNLYFGDSADQAFNQDGGSFTGARWSYDASTNRYLNYWQYPRGRGRWAYLRIADVSNTRWLLEALVARMAVTSLVRVG